MSFFDNLNKAANVAKKVGDAMEEKKAMQAARREKIQDLINSYASKSDAELKKIYMDNKSGFFSSEDKKKAAAYNLRQRGY